MNIICNKIISASTFVECYTGKYFTNTSTFKETKQRLMSCGINLGDGYRLSEFDKIKDDDGEYIVVSFSEEENYVEYEYRIMFIQKKYRNRFKRHLKDDFGIC